MNPAHWSILARRRDVPLFAASLAMALLVAACGDGGFDPAPLRAQGPAGEAALELIRAHGGMAGYLALEDLEYRATVERFNAAGVLTATYEEVHRFPVAPPRRYVLRRTDRQVRELGMDASQRIWSRIDGVTNGGGMAERVARQELWLHSVLSRSPFCLADPDVKLALAPDGKAVIATWPAPAGGERSAVFFADGGRGRLGRVVLQDPDMAMGAVMQSAAAGAFHEEEGIALVSEWALAGTDLVDGSPGLTRMRWQLDQVRSRNGFTDRLYTVENR